MADAITANQSHFWVACVKTCNMILRMVGRKTLTHNVIFCPSPPVDIIWAIMIVWRIKGKIIRTLLCCVVYTSCAQWYTHTRAVLKDDCWLLGLGLVFLHFFRFSVLCFFCFSLDCFVLVLFAFVVIGLVSSVLCRDWLGRTSLQIDLFCVQ